MNELIHQFNRFSGDKKSLIKKALDSSVGVGEALIPEHLEQVITNTITRLSPEIQMMIAKFDRQKFHEFDRITSIPSAGGAMGENATTPTKRSTYERDSVQLKIVRRKGAVTNFLQDTAGDFIDSAAAEMENHLLSHVFDMIYYSVHGNAAANKYEYSGLDKFIVTNRTNEIAGGVVLNSLTTLDRMIDLNTRKQGAQHKKAFLMSPEMLSRVSQLLTNVRLNQGLTSGGLTQVEVGGGWRLNAYRDVPIIETSSLTPLAQMTAIGGATGTGGTIVDDTYYFMVAPVTWDGEQLASAELAVVVNTGGSNDGTITLSWTPYDGALSYKIYCGLTTGAANLLLVRQISAFTYDVNGTITGDTGSLLLTTDPIVAGSEINTKAALQDKPLVATGGISPESIILWDLDPFQGIGKLPYTNTAGSKFNGLVTIKPLAETDDFIPFLIKSYLALCDAFEATCVMHRGLRIA